MKKLIAIVLTVVMLASVFGIMTTALAQSNGNHPPGKLAYNLNIIGRPNDYKGGGADNGDRHTIFIPLKTDWYTDPCTTTGGQNNPGATANPVTLPTKGVTLNIVAGDSFSVLDGDATQDKSATLQVPYDPAIDNPVSALI